MTIKNVQIKWAEMCKVNEQIWTERSATSPNVGRNSVCMLWWQKTIIFHLLPICCSIPTHLQHYITHSHELDVQETNRHSRLSELDQKSWLPTPAGPCKTWSGLLQNSTLLFCSHKLTLSATTLGLNITDVHPVQVQVYSQLAATETVSFCSPSQTLLINHSNDIPLETTTLSTHMSLSAPEPQLSNAPPHHLSSLVGQNSLHYSQRWILSFWLPLCKLCKPSLGLTYPPLSAERCFYADPQKSTGASVNCENGQVNFFLLKPQETYRCSLDSCRYPCKRHGPNYRGLTRHWPEVAGEAVTFINWVLTRT